MMTAKIYTGSSVSTDLVQNTILVAQALENGFKKFEIDPAVIESRPIENGYYCRLNSQGLSRDRNIQLYRADKGMTDLALKQGEDLKMQMDQALGLGPNQRGGPYRPAP